MANEYVTDEELGDWLGFDDTEDIANTAVVREAVSRWVDDYCGQFFYSTTTTLTFTATCTTELDLGVPIQSITTLSTDAAGDGTFETTWSASDYLLVPRDAPHPPHATPYSGVLAVGTKVFPVAYSKRPDRVQIAGVFGWASVPPEVVQATLIQSSRVFKRRNSPEGVAGFGDFGVVRIGSRLDPDVAAMLDHPHLRRPVVA